MKMRKKLLLVSTIAVPLALPLWTTAAEEKAVETAKAVEKAPPPAKEVLAKEVQKSFYPPALTEIFDNAVKHKLTSGWSGKIKVASQDYKAMEPPRRAFQVGMTLADIAFLVLENQAAPSADLVNLAYNAISAVEPPQNIQSELQKMQDQYKSGSLKDKALVIELNRLINEVVPLITEATDPAKRDTGELLMAAGYFKALYLGAEALASSSNPTPEQLEMIQGWKDLTAHSLDYLGKQTTPAFKGSVQIEKLVMALAKINPLVSKPRGQLTKEDAALIAATLKPLFG